MEVSVLIPALLAEHTGGQRNLQVITEGAASVGAVLEALAQDHPVFDRRVRDETGSVRRYVNVYIDGDDIRTLDGLRTPLHEGQELLIIQSVAGG
ncbi:MoaD/ThiS family protein [Arthrobacter roseus]|uniref:MoaD/ThiS family protein n=1 Tax=Arthrobacter roseus TaxID=136274 RepID=UPI00308462CF|nr:molybdopterin converting factor small subunit [Arthrobacter roseus]